MIRQILAIALLTTSVQVAKAQSMVGSTCAPSASGLTKCEFDEVVAKIDRIYRPQFATLGGHLWLRANWKSNDLNAHANEYGPYWMVSFTGGLARQPRMTRDAFAMVACHEVGHHLGGAPQMMLLPLSNEGEADYFTTLKCSREFFADEDNAGALRGTLVDRYAADECKKSFATSPERLICLRSVMAAKRLVEVLQVINKDATKISFRTPETKPASIFSGFSHPKAQCRLDTFLNGARCGVPVKTALSATSYEAGSCDRKDEPPNEGSRPRCWFRP